MIVCDGAHLEASTAPLVYLADRYLQVGPGILPSSSTRFHRGVAPRSGPGELIPTVVERGRRVEGRISAVSPE